MKLITLLVWSAEIYAVQPLHRACASAEHDDPPAKPTQLDLLLAPSPPTVPPRTQRALGPELVQRRVHVFWAGDNEWYPGLVKAYSRTRGHQIAYDDGTLGSHHLDSLTNEWPWKFE